MTTPAERAPRRGLFITIEGPEGSGKSTQARRLYEAFAGRYPARVGPRARWHANRRGDPRAICSTNDYAGMAPETEMLLFAASRAQYVREVVRPVVRGRDLRPLRAVRRCVDRLSGLRPRAPDRRRSPGQRRSRRGGLCPDLTLLIDMDPAIGLARARNANGKEGTPGQGRPARTGRRRVPQQGARRIPPTGARTAQAICLVDGSRPADEVHAALVASQSGGSCDRGASGRG